MTARVFLDTNVLVYLFDSDSPQKQARAREILSRHDESLSIVLSTQVLQEFYSAATRKLATPLPPEEALEAVRRFARLEVVQLSPALILEAIAASLHSRISMRDALILEAASTAGCPRVLSEDLQHGWWSGASRVENPFRDDWNP